MRENIESCLFASTFDYFHFGYLNRGRGLWVSLRRAGRKQTEILFHNWRQPLPVLVLASSILMGRNSRDNYNYPRLVEHQFPSSINPFLIGSRSQAASFGADQPADEFQLDSHPIISNLQNCQKLTNLLRFTSKSACLRKNKLKIV